ncbi:hypothetical protein [Streptomyces lushanensis]|uniref:hypothetical protein n=1 Tax=Streptomyces lushanensis TaxID=1434255 RepID=UPI000832226D|nr:hypothetical protein [Streptomyces lushanensis]
MDSETVVAASAVAIAVASLVVSVRQGRAARRHNRNSVRPLLVLQRVLVPGPVAGLRLTNSGLGPAVVTSTVVTVDGEKVGPWNKATADRIRTTLGLWPTVVTFREPQYLAPGYDEYLVRLADYRRDHAEFTELISHRLHLEIRYESLYGGEGFRTTLIPGAL